MLSGFLTGTTQTGKLKEMFVYSESALSGETPFKLLEVSTGEVHYGTAAGTDKMMVVLGNTCSIAALPAAGVQFAN